MGECRQIYYGDEDFDRIMVYVSLNDYRAAVLAHEYFHTRQFVSAKAKNVLRAITFLDLFNHHTEGYRRHNE